MKSVCLKNLKDFSFAYYKITLVPESVILMPARNKGNILRGAFGTSLKRLVCSVPEIPDCDFCVLRDRCAYTLIFNPTGLSKTKRIRNHPRGYIIKPPLSTDKEYTGSTPFCFGFILVGNRIDYLPFVIVPLMELGRVGIGLNRGRFKLRSIESIKGERTVPLYDPATNTVKNDYLRITGKELLNRAEALHSGAVTLRFLTPTRIRFNPTGERGMSRVVRVPEFHHIIRRLRDRINALSIAYCGGPLDIDFRGLAERAMLVRTKEARLKWVEVKRRSRRSGKVHDQSGFVGSITFEGELMEFLPLLLIGEYVHVGEDAVFGNGWFRVGA